LLIRSSFNCLQTECSSATRTEGYDGFFARDGCTHFGSPGIFEKLGGELRLADAHRLHALDPLEAISPTRPKPRSAVGAGNWLLDGQGCLSPSPCGLD